ncbi:MAG: biopolymer transporter ExbD [Pirellulaceae bacterium]
MAENAAPRNDLEQDQAFSQLRARRHRRREDADLDITPMIDIVFLLLIFFIVTSKMEETANVEMPKGKYGTPVAGVDAVVLVVQRGETGSVRVLSDQGVEIASGDLLQQQEAIAQHLVQGLLGDGGRPKTTVLIKGDRNLKQRDIKRVVDAITAAKQQVDVLENFHLGILEEQ